ncbi:sigma-70 family RNA polymerase sigma factor [Lysobacter sp. CFH 32150]|uniref:sigma-70 family RNA polymerase sigma factor n=1 Tax=Lysobacter sp. CFH 32150 TaxID=2927128 RepID=UPI001FA71313|nr:sigma-70 family RNA polymerase sigma factor [Lysobacter sp. CFH 32150]MCI4568969.1 sigma-70 family RNA polymerase sigma factor [Lysobacter sp. CFH 32150]
MSHSSLQLSADPSENLTALLAEVANGSRSAFEALYRATSGKLFGICMRLLSDRAEAEDVLQEVYVSVWHKAAQFDAARASAITWLGMIARYKAIDRLRVLPASHRHAPIEWADDVADPLASPLQYTETTTQRARLDDCMEQLDDRRRMLIHTAFFEGITYEELAVRSSSPLGSIKSWIRRGLMQLRACLEQ